MHACLIHSNSSCRAPRLGRCIRIYLKRCFLGSRIKPLCSPIAWGRVRAVKNGRGLYKTKWLSLDPRLPLHCCLHPKMRIPPSTDHFKPFRPFACFITERPRRERSGCSNIKTSFLWIWHASLTWHPSTTRYYQFNQRGKSVAPHLHPRRILRHRRYRVMLQAFDQMYANVINIIKR